MVALSSDFGDGSDGDLNVTGTVNINSHAQPGPGGRRSLPSRRRGGRHHGQHSSGIVRGDEVLLINLHGSHEDHGSAGNYETLFVTDVNYENTMTAVIRAYGLDGANDDLDGQLVMIQRVPHYRAVTVRVDSTFDGEQVGLAL